MLETSRPAACKLRQLSVSVAQQGLRATLYWAVYGYLRPNRFIVLRWKRSSAAALPIPGVSYATWDAAEMRRRRQNRSALPPAFFQDQIDGVRRCVVAVVDDEVVGCIWIYGPGDVSRLFDLEPYDVELNHGCVLPSCRARGIFSSMLFFGATQLAAEGHRRVYAGVHAQNTASMKSFTRAGFDVIGTVRHVGPYRPKYRLRHGLIGKVLVDPMGVPIGRICDVRTRWQRDERVV